MNKSVCVLTVVCAVLPAPVAVAQAAKTVWVGRDVTKDRVHWTCTNTVGDTWTLKKGGIAVGVYQAVESTSDHVELVARGAPSNRVRLYSDKLAMNEAGSRFKWITTANGKWSR